MATDHFTAVRTLELATEGEDVDKLSKAILAAAFLDERPGSDRQKLRLAKSRLRRLQLKTSAPEARTGNGEDDSGILSFKPSKVGSEMKS